MVSRADLPGARPVAPIEGTRPASPVGDPRQEAFDRFVANSVGKQFRAEIMSRLNDGSFVLKLADTAVRMNLPAGAQIGDRLDLTLISARPRPTFLLGAPTDPSDGKTTLSNAGRLIDRLLQAAQKEGAPAALVGKTPVVPSPSATTEQVASALKNTLAFSGLFYESHVGQWANGNRQLADLLREPQARNSNPQLLTAALHAGQADDSALTAPDLPDPSDAEVGHAVGDAHEPAPADRPKTEASPAPPRTLPNSAPADPATIASKAAATKDASAAVVSQDAAPARAETLNTESVRMISLQLDTLEQQRVAWQGELWPGQPMEWEVTKDAPNHKAPEEERSWQSVVRFELPTLGAVAASIRLTGGRLQVQVRAAREDTAHLLRDRGGELATALEAAGSPLDLLTVRRDDTVQVRTK